MTKYIFNKRQICFFYFSQQ